MDLKAQIKTWERDFYAKNNRKPGSADIKSDQEIHRLYKEYNKRKALEQKAVPSTPRQQKRESQVAQTELIEQREAEETEPEVNEIFPTPQIGGRLLGLFEIRLPPGTPSKRVETTPQKQRVAATPSSRRTPTYLRQRCDEISPFKQRSRRYRSISEMATQAACHSDDEVPTMSLAEIAQFSLVDQPKVPEPQAAPTDEAPAKKFKRKNRKVLRPVLATDVAVTTKEKQNFQRLNIQHKKIPMR